MWLHGEAGVDHGPAENAHREPREHRVLEGVVGSGGFEPPPPPLNPGFRFGPGMATVYTHAAPNAPSFRAEPCNHFRRWAPGLGRPLTDVELPGQGT
jgi:hypothetical protein